MNALITVFIFALGSFCIEGDDPAHAFYVSTAVFTQKEKDTPIQLRITVFSDDLQAAVQNASKLATPPSISSLCGNNIDSTLSYFADHIELYIDGKHITPEYRHCEISGDTHSISYILHCDKEWTEISISMDYFMELFPTQTQMVHFTRGVEAQMARLTADDKKCIIEFTD